MVNPLQEQIGVHLHGQERWNFSEARHGRAESGITEGPSAIGNLVLIFFDREANATTEDLRHALEKSSGKNLKDFFARWVYGAGHPRYQLGLGSMERASVAVIFVNLRQLQDGEAFLDPVPIEFTVNGQKKLETIYPKGKVTSVTIRLNANPTSVEIDPDGTLLKEVVSR